MPATTRDITPSLLDLADVRYPGDNLAQSLLSLDFAPRPRMVHAIGGLIDYDRARRAGPCAMVTIPAAKR